MRKAIVSFNINVSMLINEKILYKISISQIAAYIKRTYYEISVIVLQEVLPGKEGKYLRQIQNAFVGYEMILLMNKHWKSVITVVLVKEHSEQLGFCQTSLLRHR